MNDRSENGSSLNGLLKDRIRFTINTDRPPRWHLSVSQIRLTAAVLWLLTLTVPAAAHHGTGAIKVTELQITRGVSTQIDASVDNGNIVYATHSSGDYDIVMFDAEATIISIASGTGNQTTPMIENNSIVYTDDSFGDRNVFYYSTADEVSRLVTRSSASDSSPAVSGDNIVYVTSRNGDDDIWWFSLDTFEENPVTTGGGYESSPSIDGNLVAWQADNVTYDIYAAFLGNAPFAAVDTSAEEIGPSVSGNLIAYSSDGDIAVYDVTTTQTTMVTSDAYTQKNVKIEGDNIAFMDNRNGNWDIYLYVLSTQRLERLTFDTDDQELTDISGNRCVYHDDRYGDYNVWETTWEFNHLPVADAGEDQFVAAGQTVQLSGSGADPNDGDPIVSYRWAFDLTPNGSTAVLSDPNSADPNFIADMDGRYTVSLVVNDGFDDSEPDTISITAGGTGAIKTRERLLSGSRAPQLNAAADPSNTVYVDRAFGNDDVRRLDEWGNYFDVATGDLAQNDPDIDGNHVVYVENYDGDKNIFLHYIAENSNRMLTSSHANEFSPAIDANNIVYVSDRNSDDDIYWFDLDTFEETAVTVGGGYESSPAIDGNLVAWRTSEYGSNSIYGAELGGTPFPVYVGDSTAYGPSISGSLIAYNIDCDIAVYDHNTGQTSYITSDGFDTCQSGVKINGDYVSFLDNRNGNLDIYLYVLSTQRLERLTFDTDDQELTDISGNRVVYHDIRAGDLNVWETTWEFNNIPVADAGGNQTIDAGQTVQLNGSATDDDSDPIVSWDWSIDLIPNGSTAVLSDNSIPNPTFVPDLPGMYVLSLIVNDGWDSSPADTVTITAAGGNLTGWGRNHYTQIDVPSGNDYASVAAGRYHSVALKSDGTLAAWGSDDNNEVTDTPTDNDFVAIAAGQYHNLALKADGSIDGWGNDDYNQVSNTPTDANYVAIGGGGWFSMALKNDGSIASWGNDNFDQVTDTPADTNYVAISAGGYHGVALKTDGSLVTWGYDDYNQVTDTPTDSNFMAVAAGTYHSLALTEAGSIVAWGQDDEGQVGDTPADSNFVAIAAGLKHSLALTADGSVAAWGRDLFDEVSDTPATGTFISIAAGHYHNLAIYHCPLNADFDGDCDVDGLDLAALAQYWLQNEPAVDIAEPYGIVNLKEFSLLAEQWLQDMSP